MKKIRFANILLALIFAISYVLPPMATAQAAGGAITLVADSFSSSNVSSSSSDTTLIYTQGDAAATGGVLRVAPAVGGKAGTAITRNPLSVADGFSTFFKININSGSAIAADGLVFYVRDTTHGIAPAGYGGGLGYAGMPGASFGVEFDTFPNTGSPTNDPDYGSSQYCHVAIIQNGDNNHASSTVPTRFDALYNNDVYIWIDYDNSGLLTVTFGTSSTRSSGTTITKNVGTYLIGEDIYAGFASATGGQWANFDVKKWYYSGHYTAGGLSSSGGYTQGVTSMGITLNRAGNPTGATITSYIGSTAQTSGSIEVFIDGDSKGTITSSTSQNFTNFSGLTQGTHTLKTIADDGVVSSKTFIVGYAITYDGNGSTGGSIPTDGNAYLSGDTVTILGNTGSLTKTGYPYMVWNTKADGTGSDYTAGTSFAMATSDVTLYARWFTEPKWLFSTSGGTVSTYTSGGKTYEVHKFTSSGTLSVTNPYGIGQALSADYLLVAGGGGGGSRSGASGWGGGGGGGGVISGTASLATGTSYTIAVGAGGASGTNGGDSTFYGYTASGGGAGGAGSWGATTSPAKGNDGGSGGGGSVGSPGGNGITGQGKNGSAATALSTPYFAGGGGGAGAAGNTNGTGGTGLPSSITGTSTYYAGGGGGCSEGTQATPAGGNGGGGSGSRQGWYGPTSGSANTGGGGGGGIDATYGGSGGSGVVIVRFDITSYLAFNGATYSTSEKDGSVNITVSRTGGVSNSVTIDYATSNGTATAASDYTATNGTLTFAAGEISKTFSVPISYDSDVEGSETINLTLSNPGSGAALGTQSTAVLTITDSAGVTYHGNYNSSGSVPIDNTSYTNGATVTVMDNTGSLAKNGFTFSGWNTAADGSGTTYLAGATFTIGSSGVILYAKWTWSGSTNYIASGGTVSTYTSNGKTYEVHKYTGNGTFTVTDTYGNGSSLYCDYLIVGGGGGSDGGRSGIYFGNGGGGGQVVTGSTSLAVGAHNITIGSGGAAGGYLASSTVTTITGSQATNGGMSSIDTIVATGGKGGWLNTSANGAGKGGDSGSGKSGAYSGTGSPYPGGGGAGDKVGGSGVNSGAGSFCSITGTNTAYGGGGASNNSSGAGIVGAGGTAWGNAAAANTGAGAGGGAASGTGGYAGGSGVVIIRIDITSYLQLSSATYTASEKDGTVLVTVNRTGGTSGSVTVNYATSDGTATAGSDYTATSGTLTFAAGVVSKTFSIPITADLLDESAETVNITLSTPSTGAALGTQTTAVLTISDAYQVIYNGNTSTSGAVPTDSTKYLPTETVTVLGNTGSLVKTGYTFGGWNTKADGSGTGRAAGSSFLPTGNTTLYAVWTINQYTTTFDANGGGFPSSGGASTMPMTRNYGTQLTPPEDPTRAGYTFQGWYTNVALTTAMPSPYTVSAAATIYAKWSINTYNITYDGNGSTGGTTPASQSATYNSSLTLRTNSGSLVRTGYTFGGWNTTASGSGTAYAAGGTLVVPANDVTLYAVWSINSYSISYDGNGNTQGTVPSGATYHYGTAISVSGAGTLAKTGYTFADWNTMADGTGTAYAALDALTLGAANVTLYAQWTINSYHVTYDGNGETGGSAATDTDAHNYLTSVTVKGNTGLLYRVGYTFSGWNTVSDGSGSGYSAGSTFTMPASDMTLYAVWSINSYSVSYDGNGNTSGSAPSSNTYQYGTTVTAKTAGSLARTGYTFDGWNTKADGSGTSYAVADTFTLGAANVTLYAQWAINTYTITYDGNGSSGGSIPADQSGEYLSSVALRENTGSLVKTGYSFAGWNTAADGTGTGYNAGGTITVPATDLTLFAVWTINSYQVSYDGNGATGGSTPSGETLLFGATITVADDGSLVKTGYTFENWNTKADGSGTSFDPADTFALGAGNVTLFAQWTINQYALAYDGNGSDGGTTPIGGQKNYGVDITVEACTFTLTGNTFIEWNTAANGSGTTYATGTVFAMPASDVTIYAIWEPNDYTVSYDGNGNSGGSVPTSAQYTYHTNATVKSKGTLVKTGYSFAGWNTAANGSGTQYDPADLFLLGAVDVTLFAQWTINNYTVIYDGNGSDGGTVPSDTNSPYNYGESATVLDNTGLLVRTGYTFGGWNTADDGSGTGYTAGASFSIPAGDVTLYAVWNINTYSVSYDGNGYTGGSVPASGMHLYDATVSVSAIGSLSKAGYTFKEWNTQADGSGTAYSPAHTFHMGADNLTLFAQWEINSYTLGYDANGADSGSAPDSDVKVYQTEVSVTGNTGILIKTGYTFAGWNTADDGSGTGYLAGAKFNMPASDVTLYAVWNINSYSVSYDGNGSTAGSVPAAGTHDYDSTVTVSTSGSLYRTGHTFKNWNTESDGSGTAYDPADTFALGAANVTLYAQWTVNDYTVHYNANGSDSGTVPDDAISAFQAITTAEGNSGSLEKVGYTFIGWNTIADGTGTGYVEGDTFSMPAHNVTLYALWAINSYTVSYDGNGKTGGNIPAAQTGDYATEITLKENTGLLVKTGYSFDGWNTAANGSGTSYAISDSYTIPAANTTIYAVWVINQYTLNFDSCGGSTVVSITQDYNTTIAEPADPTKLGYTFAGWYTDTSLTTAAEFPYTITGNATVYAKWTINSYSVTYDANSAVGGNTPNDADLHEYQSSVTVQDNTGALVKTGYSFAGWNTTDDGSGSGYSAGDTFSMPASDVTLYATWQINNYTVSYDGNGNTGGSVPSSSTFAYGATATVKPAGSLTRIGYTFAGWDTQANGNGTSYDAADTFALGASNVTLFAQWEINSYYITYDENGADSGDAPVDTNAHQYQSSVAAESNSGTLAKVGYSFDGWNTKADGTGTGYDEGDVFQVPASDITLYAMWTINHYTISYDGNGSTGGITPTSGTYLYGATVTVEDNGSLLKTGYMFAGWNTKADGSGTARAATETFTLGATNVTLYAQWTINQYMLVYDGNGSDGGTAPVGGQKNYGDNIMVASNTFTLTGHTFIEWNTAADGSGITYATGDVFAMPASDVTIYAIWVPNDYTVSYDGNGNTAGSVPTSGQFTYHTQATVSSHGSMVKTGYSFTGWNTKANGSGTPYAEGATFTLGAADVTLFAQWAINSYTVNYDGNGSDAGTAPTDASSPYEYNASVTVLDKTVSLERTGYTFEGWNTKSDGTGTGYSTDDDFNMPAGDVTLYAVWTINTYSVSYDGNGSTGGSIPSAVNYVYQTTVTVEAVGILTKTGFTFKEWNTKSDGSGIAYDPNDTFNLGAGNVTLFAQWSINSYTVTYNANNADSGSVPTDLTSPYEYGHMATVLGNTGSLSKTGYTFSDWNTESDGSGTNYAAGNTFGMPANDVALYANWLVNTYTVSYDENGSTGGDIPAAQSGSYASDITLHANTGALTRAGYTFAGWNTAMDGSGTSYVEGETYNIPAGNTTLYAEWTVNVYNVTYDGNLSTGGTTPSGQSGDYLSTLVLQTNLGNLEKAGYTFAGWNTSDDGSGVGYAAGGNYIIPSHDTTLYAVWALTTFSVEYDGNGSTSGTAPDSQTAAYSSTIELQSNTGTLSKNGYTFIGWNSKADGTGTSYGEGAYYTIPADDTTLFAVWSINQYTLTFDSNGGSAISPITQNYNTSVAAPADPTRDEYAFEGWFIDSGLTSSAAFPYTLTDNTILYAKWKATIFHITYDGNGNLSGTAPAGQLGPNDTTLTLQTNSGNLAKTGYTFSGWNTEADGSGSGYSEGDSYLIPAYHVTLYAQWTINSYSVSYDGNGSTGGSVPAAAFHDYASTVMALGVGSLSRTGYSFAGWNTKADQSGTAYSAGDTFTIGTENITLYAQWTINSYSVTYDANYAEAGTVPSDPVAHDYNTSVTVLDAMTTLTRTGYVFDGWNTTSDGSGTGYQAGGAFNMPGNDVTLFAAWAAIDYIVAYDGNGNTKGAAPSSEIHHYGSTVTVSDDGSLGKEGYAFTGWNTKADGSGSSYVSADTFIQGTNNTTLYAQWTIKQYTLQYDGNGNDGGSSPSGGSITYQMDITVSNCSYTNTGLSFIEWNTSANGSGTTYAPGAVFAMPAETVTLYAIWTPNDYTVTYDGNGNTGGSAPSSEQYAYLTTATASDHGSLKKTGYSFDGWNTKADGSGTSYDEGDSFTLGASDETLYAQWAINTYSVSYNENGADGGAAPLDTASPHTYGTSVTVMGNTGSLTRIGSTFTGWNTAADGTGIWYVAGGSFNMPADDLTLYAYWTMDNYSVSYDGNGYSAGTAPAAQMYHYGDTVVASDTGDLARTGHTFKTWNTKADGSGTSCVPGDTFGMGAGSVTLYAQWDINSYSVTYQTNGAQSGNAPLDAASPYVYNTAATVLGNTGALARTGYSYAGWNTQSDANGTGYSAGDTFAVPGQDVVLYAVWNANTYSVSYNGNGQTGGATPSAQYEEYSATLMIDGNSGNLIRTGYTFSGWNTAADGSGTSYGSGDSFTIPAGNTLLYAEWSANTYHIAYDANHSTGGTVPLIQTVNYNTSVALSVNSGSLVRTGYTFIGWNTKADGTGTDYAEGAFFNVPANDTTFYAKWEANTYKITYYGNGNSGGATPAIQAGTYSSTVTLQTNSGNLERSGYTFAGWNVLPDGTGTNYLEGASFTIPDADSVFYANWTAVTYYVSFDGNGSTGGTAPTAGAYHYLSTVTVAGVGSLTRAHYTFVGWNTKADGTGTSYLVGDTFSMDAADLTLYAVWSLNPTYTITYDGNSSTAGSVPIDPNNYETGDTVTVLGNSGSLEKTNNTFVGWNTKADGSGTTYTVGASLNMGAENKILYAMWTRNPTFTVVYSGNGSTGGTVPVDTNNYDTGATATVLANSGQLARAYYKFAGWNTQADGKGTLYTPGASLVIGSSNVTLFAFWELRISDADGSDDDDETTYFNITYYGNGNTSGFPPKDYADYETGDKATVRGNPNLMAKEGFTFIGWNIWANQQGIFYHPGDKIAVGSEDIYLYAMWTKNPTLSVIYDPNGSTDGEVPSDENFFEEGSKATVLDNYGNLEKTGFHFNGWNTKADGSGLSYNAGDSFIMSDSNITLYAVWSQNYDITVVEDQSKTSRKWWVYTISALSVAAGISLTWFGILLRKRRKEEEENTEHFDV